MPPPRGRRLRAARVARSIEPGMIIHWRAMVWRLVMVLPIAPAMSSAAERRQKILDAIARSAALAKRDPADVELIAVSKGRGAAEVEALIEAGQRDFGENRVQEALAKWPALLARHPGVRLH